MITRDTCLARDAGDPLAPLRERFALERLDAQGVIYLDGNSLGVLPKATAERVRQVVEEEWGVGLVRSWNSAGWITLSRRVADKIAPLVGAAPGELIVADSTSINLYKVLSAAIAIVAPASAAPDATAGTGSNSSASPSPSSNSGSGSGSNSGSPNRKRRRIVSERSNFPTDLYVADTLARAHGLELTLVDVAGGGSDGSGDGSGSGDGGLSAYFDDRLAILLLTHVNYRTGRMHRMADITRAAHAAGAIVIWDLAHSAGAVPVDLHGGGAIEDAADFAVGCGYKYLNGGPGAPAFAWAHPRHTARMDRDAWRQPLSGWFGHAAPFDFTPGYQPAPGMSRFLCGTPPILSLAALECGVETLLAADAHGGLAALRQKSIALTDLFIRLVESRCAGHGLTLVTPRHAAGRGSQVAFAHASGAYAITQALIARGVIGDFRAPDILRFGFAPLYTRFVDVWDAADRLEQVLASGEWRAPEFNVRAAVT
jgi:kynureninase